eukprot:scaffold4709_cov212-Amphora_coffeaeformis.AAC.5
MIRTLLPSRLGEVVGVSSQGCECRLSLRTVPYPYPTDLANWYRFMRNTKERIFSFVGFVEAESREETIYYYDQFVEFRDFTIFLFTTSRSFIWLRFVVLSPNGSYAKVVPVQ